MKTDILFINPPWYKSSGNVWKAVGACLPPFCLGLLAALSRQRGYRADVLDCNALHIGLDALDKNLPSKPPRFVGLTATTVLIAQALEAAKITKQKYPQTKTIIGGVHCTVLPEEVLSCPSIDYIVMGEGEYALLDILAGKDPADILGLGWKKNGSLFFNPQGPTIPDINIFPFMAYDLLPMDKYYPAAGGYKRLPSLGMITSRGCPGRCTFCKGNVLGELIRFRTAEKIFEEIVFLQKNYGIRDIAFYDDTFTANRKNVLDFCRLLLENPAKGGAGKTDLTWSCFSRVDTINEEMLSAMKKAGCHQIMYGVESADPQILQNINKRISLEKVEETVKATKKAGIETRLAFMFGNPGETEETVKKTIDYSIYLRPDLVSYNITTPYPGTVMFEWADKNGYLLHKKWPEYDLSKPIMELPTISPEKVLSYYKYAYRKFYFRAGYVFQRLKRIRSFNDLKRNLSPFFSFARFLFAPGRD
ncbi:MAG: radical SAM protein [Patescibacteria group bacterium]